MCVRECTLQLKVNLHKPGNLLKWQVLIQPIVHLSMILSVMHLLIHQRCFAYVDYQRGNQRAREEETPPNIRNFTGWGLLQYIVSVRQRWGGGGGGPAEFTKLGYAAPGQNTRFCHYFTSPPGSTGYRACWVSILWLILIPW